MNKEKKIYVVGIGPGSYEGMTGAAVAALEKSDVIVGYTVYIDLVKDHFAGKSFLTTPMRKEVDRCVMAFDEAMNGQTVSMICSGDAGVYGMAGLMYEVGANYPDVDIEVVAGVTAATGGAAVLGAPLIHDFCLISLSDLLTPWEKIEKRLLLASEADFVICLYNPSSPNSFRSTCCCIHRGFYCSYISLYHHCYQSAAYLCCSKTADICCF